MQKITRWKLRNENERRKENNLFLPETSRVEKECEWEWERVEKTMWVVLSVPYSLSSGWLMITLFALIKAVQRLTGFTRLSNQLTRTCVARRSLQDSAASKSGNKLRDLTWGFPFLFLFQSSTPSPFVPILTHDQIAYTLKQFCNLYHR